MCCLCTTTKTRTLATRFLKTRKYKEQLHLNLKIKKSLFLSLDAGSDTAKSKGHRQQKTKVEITDIALKPAKTATVT